MHKRVCPLYSFDAAGKAHMVGSAVPFMDERGSFLITAAHVCFDRFKKPIPLFTWVDSGPLVLREFRIAWDYQPGRMPDADVALLSLSVQDAATLKQSYWFSDSAGVCAALPKTPGVHYLIAGYPFVRNRVTSTELAPPAMATHLITGHIESVQKESFKDKADAHHFALSFPMGQRRTLGGGVFRVPKPQGMSGGGVWRLGIDVATSMATMPQLAGIGIECHKTKEARVFLATRVQLALSLATDLHDFLKTGALPMQNDDR
jgi:hypothetical protein